MGTTQTVHRRACEDFAAKLEQGNRKQATTRLPYTRCEYQQNHCVFQVSMIGIDLCDWIGGCHLRAVDLKKPGKRIGVFTYND
jgi:hypothetical protein